MYTTKVGMNPLCEIRLRCLELALEMVITNYKHLNDNKGYSGMTSQEVVGAAKQFEEFVLREESTEE